jgi:hypothetical protein
VSARERKQAQAWEPLRLRWAGIPRRARNCDHRFLTACRTGICFKRVFRHSALSSFDFCVEINSLPTHAEDTRLRLGKPNNPAGARGTAHS